MHNKADVLYIKNMVCQRCIFAVENSLKTFGISYSEVQLGVVYLTKPIDEHRSNALFANLENIGFERVVIADKKLVEDIKRYVIQHIRVSEEMQKDATWSLLLAHEFNKDYSRISKIFSELEGVTIEHYIILQKIERIKELLLYNEQSISEIAYALGYSSSQFLSTQFKQHTGLTPTQFKHNHKGLRISLDDV